jgi:O-acetylhomoserine (thiol)-lyase
MDVFGPGRHTLSTANIPVLTEFISRFTGGGSNVFAAEVYFVNQQVLTDLKWGTPNPIDLKDPDLGWVQLRAFGTMSVRVEDPQLFVNTLVGTRPEYTAKDLNATLKGAIRTRLNDLLSTTFQSYARIRSNLDELVAAMKVKVKDDFGKYGVSLRDFFIQDVSVPEEIQAAFRPNTKAMFGETISNPGCAVFDIERFAKIAHKNGVPLIVDNTFATPINCRPFEWGADIVTHSTTKYMDGMATQVGGVVVDSGNFPWLDYADKFPGLCTPDESYHGLTYVKAFGKMGYTTKLVAQLMRDLGSIPAPQNSFLLHLGLQTLHLRVAQHCKNAQKVAEFLHDNEKVAWVHYCGLPDDKAYALGQKYLPNGSCGVIAFGLKGDRETAIKWMDSLQMINIVTHVADARTCVLHPASHTHRQLSDEQLREAGVAPDLIRLYVGIEDVEDILDDIKQALNKI